MDAVLIVTVIIFVCVILAFLVTLLTMPAKPKSKTLVCGCKYVRGDNQFCPLHGNPIPATKNGKRLL